MIYVTVTRFQKTGRKGDTQNHIFYLQECIYIITFAPYSVSNFTLASASSIIITKTKRARNHTHVCLGVPHKRRSNINIVNRICYSYLMLCWLTLPYPALPFLSCPVHFTSLHSTSLLSSPPLSLPIPFKSVPFCSVMYICILFYTVPSYSACYILFNSIVLYWNFWPCIICLIVH